MKTKKIHIAKGLDRFQGYIEAYCGCRVKTCYSVCADRAEKSTCKLCLHHLNIEKEKKDAINL